jgi:hypothetical protein
VTTFGVSGKLIRNVLVMYDRQTESLWSQILGEAVEGERKGTKLESVPSRMTTWEDWKAQHPDTLALVKGRSGAADPYDSYYESQQPGVIGETFQDDRLQTKQLLVGVSVAGGTAVYPFSVLAAEPLVNDLVGDVPVLVVLAASDSGVAFERTLDGQTLSFSLDDPEALTMIDAETGSTWDGRSGLAVDGPLAGQQLPRVKSTHAFWFCWKDFYPETRVYETDR